MKFSFDLLPTRNRVRYLEYAMQTVLRQDYGEWEIIVSDNDSDEDVEGLCRTDWRRAREVLPHARVRARDGQLEQRTRAQHWRLRHHAR